MTQPVRRTCALILNWNGLAITRTCIEALRDAKFPLDDVVVADNGSTDGSPDAIAREFPSVQQHVMPTNTGYAGGNSIALRKILDERRYDRVLLMNNDALVTSGMPARLERELDERPKVAIAQPKIIFPDGTVENAGYTMDRFGVTHPRGRGKPAATTFAPEGWFYTSGACVLIRVDALRDVGLFDEAYFCYHEDVDLAWRLRLAGWELAYCDDVTCMHDESTTAGRSPKKIGLIWRNRWRTLLKDAPLRRLPGALALTLGIALGVSVKERDPAYVALYFRSLGWNARRLRDTLRLRRAIQRARRVPEREIRARMRPSVEWAMIRKRLD